jgi:hypothetical protein
VAAAAGLALAATIEPRSSYALTMGAVALAGGGIGAAGGAIRGPAQPDHVVGWAAAGATVVLAAAVAAFEVAQADDRAGGASFEHALATGVGRAAALLLVLVAAAALVAWRLRPASSAAARAGASSPPPRRPA